MPLALSRMPTNLPPPQDAPGWKNRIHDIYTRIRSLQGDPHYVAVGMAVGVFVAFTPTIPFHTILAISLAFVFRGSKPAALIGSWLCNPLTIPAFYYGSYRLGVILSGHNFPATIAYGDFKALLTMGWDMAVATMAGGILLGILPAVGAYFLTLRLVQGIRSRHAKEPFPPSGSGANRDDDPQDDSLPNDDISRKGRP